MASIEQMKKARSELSWAIHLLGKRREGLKQAVSDFANRGEDTQSLQQGILDFEVALAEAHAKRKQLDQSLTWQILSDALKP